MDEKNSHTAELVEEEHEIQLGFEESHERLKISEKERSMDSYYLLMDLMHQKDSVNEIHRMGKMVQENEGDLDLKVKVGIARRKAYDTHKNYPNFVKEHFKSGTKGKIFFREARMIDPTNIHVLYNITKLFVNEKNEEKFQKYYSLMKTNHPESPWTCFVRGFYLVKMDRTSEGIEYFERNLEKLSVLKSTLKYTLVNLKKSYLKLKNRPKNLECIHKINEAFVSSKDTHFGLKKLGWHYITKSKSESCSVTEKEEFLQKAEDSFLQALKIATTRVYHGLGVVYEHRKKYQLALKYHEKEIENDPFALVCFRRKVFCLMKLERLDEALECMKRVEFIKPAVENHLRIADIMNSHIEKHGLIPAIEYLKKTASDYDEEKKENEEEEGEEGEGEKEKNEKERRMNLYKIYDFMSVIQYRNKRYGEAYMNANKAIECKPEGFEAFLMKGKCILFIHRLARGEKDTTDALECFHRVIELSGESIPCRKVLYDAYRMIGWIHEQVRWLLDFEKSLFYYKKSKDELQRLGGVSNQIKIFYVDERISYLYIQLKQFGKAYRRVKNKVLVGYDKFIKGSEKIENAYRYQKTAAEIRMKKLEAEQPLEVLLGGKGERKRREDFLERIEYFEDLQYEKVVVAAIHGGSSLLVYEFLYDMKILT